MTAKSMKRDIIALNFSFGVLIDDSMIATGGPVMPVDPARIPPKIPDNVRADFSDFILKLIPFARNNTMKIIRIVIHG